MDTKQAIEHVAYILAFAFVAWRWARNAAALRRSKAEARKERIAKEHETGYRRFLEATHRVNYKNWIKHIERIESEKAEALALAGKWKKRAQDEKASHLETCREGGRFCEEVNGWIRDHHEEVKRLTEERDEAKKRLSREERRTKNALKSVEHWFEECHAQEVHLGRIRDAWDNYTEALERCAKVTSSHIDAGRTQHEGTPVICALYRLRAAIRGGQDAEGEGDAGGSVQVPEGAPEGGTVRTEE